MFEVDLHCALRAIFSTVICNRPVVPCGEYLKLVGLKLSRARIITNPTSL